MSERDKPHNGRDLSGQRKVKQTDVEELKADPAGAEFMRDDVRLGGAVQDTGPGAAQRSKRIGDLIESNRDDVEQSTESD
jgi:hypothetical protein